MNPATSTATPPAEFPFAAIWHGPGHDERVTVIGEYGQDDDGQSYFQIEGSPTGVPASQIVPAVDGLILRVSLFDNKRDAAPKPAERTWAQICADIEQPIIRTEKDGALFSPARFDPPHRKKENVVDVSQLVLDYDHGADFDRDTSAWREHGLAFAAYTTHSSYRATEQNPNAEERLRIIIPLAKPILAAEFPKLWQWAAKVSGGKVDVSAKDVSRMFYAPAIAEAGARYRFSLHDGAPLDWRTLDLEPEADQSDVMAQSLPVGSREDAYGQAALRNEAARVLAAANGHRNETLNRAAFALGQLAASGLLTENEIAATLERAAVVAGLPANEAQRTIKSGLQAGAKEPRQPPTSKQNSGAQQKSKERSLYCAPELQAADPRATVFICQSEKSADALRALGLVATANPEGVGKWRDEYAAALREREVVILPNNDRAGREDAETIARSLYGVAASVKVLILPDLAEKGSVAGWLDAGADPEQLCVLAEGAPEWTSSAVLHSQVLNRILATLGPCDFQALGNFPPQAEIKQKHYLVLCIKQLLATILKNIFSRG